MVPHKKTSLRLQGAEHEPLLLQQQAFRPLEVVFVFFLLGHQHLALSSNSFLAVWRCADVCVQAAPDLR